MGITDSGVSTMIRSVYQLLGLSTYLTTGEKETRAWTIKSGAKAPEAAGVIHTDFERGFIAAEVLHYDDYVEFQSKSAARDAGKLRIEAKNIWSMMETLLNSGSTSNYSERNQCVARTVPAPVEKNRVLFLSEL